MIGKILGLFAVGLTILFTSISGVFAAAEEKDNSTSSGVTTVSVNQSGTVDQDESSGTGKKQDDVKKSKKDLDKDAENEEDENKEKVQQEINAYILEAYKIQGNKILRDIDLSLQKINSDADTRIQAYIRIEKTLEMRKKRVQNMDLSDNNKEILIKYLEYLISILEKKQAELKKG